jgi:nucleoside-diphosphate-sugar epimerase
MGMISLKGKRVTLIGGAGFIGHHLALRLRDQGALVDIIDGLLVNNIVTFEATVDGAPNRELYLHLLNERQQLLRDAGISVHLQDARDYTALSHLLNAVRPDVIVMLAAVSHAGKANKNPYNTFDHSMRTLENALDCARDVVEHFVFFSSSMVYGNFPTEIVDETTPCEPLGIYGALKFGGEKLVIAYNQVFDMPYTIIRPSALYGERCVSRRVAQVFLENAFKGLPLNVKGDGDDRLDFTYVQDLVSGVVDVLTHEEARNEVFNITYGSSRSIADLIEIIAKEIPDLDVRYEPSDALMPERGTLSVEKARELIGYEPSHPLERGLVDYIAWYRDLFERNPGLLTAP